MTESVVHLVGAGPGGVGSLTRRAARLLAGADVVVLDRPSLTAIADLAPATAERIHVGRAPGATAWTTDEIVDLLAERARTGAAVVRLKGGDPFVCSRGAEEALALVARGFVVDVTAGVTAATAAAAVSGQDRGAAFTVASGNHDPVGPDVTWAEVDGAHHGDGAVIVLTGRSHQGDVADGLVAGGRTADDPVAVVHGAGRPDQEVRTTRLGDVATVRLAPPAAMVVGPRPPGGDRAHP